MEFTKEPVSRFLINSSVCSQRNAKNFIKNNEVLINGIRISESSFLIDSENDVVTVNKKRIPSVKHTYLMLNKPQGVVCSTVSDSHSTVYDLLRGKIPEYIIDRLKCAGRLDSDTTGLLLMSTNGSFVNALTDPDNKITKTYSVKLRDKVNPQEQNEYSKIVSLGVKIPPEKKSPAFTSKPAELKWISEDSVEITVTEGKFHEVRRIFSALGNFVIELKRLSMGDFLLGELLEGEVKAL